MIHIGIDAVDIERFTKWARFSRTKLQRIFSDQEINYCLSEPSKAAERLAVRFAAKEALYKALSQIECPLSFLFVCRNCQVVKSSQGIPSLAISNKLSIVTSYTKQLSLTHTQHTAIAVVMLISSYTHHQAHPSP